jgi:RNA polymerase sigma-70 factor (ECF subfamily)
MLGRVEEKIPSSRGIASKIEESTNIYLEPFIARPAWPLANFFLARVCFRTGRNVQIEGIDHSPGGPATVRHSTDKAAEFQALLRPVQRPLEVYCRRMLRDARQVEDVLQGAVAAAFAKFDGYTPGTNFRAWMFRFVTLEIFNCNRKREPLPWGELPIEVAQEPTLELPAVDELLDALRRDPDALLEHFDDLIAAALRELPAPERAVLLLRAIGEFSYQEIHVLLSIPLGSVIGYLSRARQKLRRALADYAAQRGIAGRGSSPREARP